MDVVGEAIGRMVGCLFAMASIFCVAAIVFFFLWFFK